MEGAASWLGAGFLRHLGVSLSVVKGLRVGIG